MNNLTSLSRCFTLKNSNLKGILYLSRNVSNKKTDTSSSSSSDTDTKSQQKKGTDAVSKLNTVLQDMLAHKQSQREPIATARPSRKLRATDKKENSVTQELIQKSVVESVKEVAQSIGGNVKQTESELLAKLLSTSPTSKSDQNTTNLSLVQEFVASGASGPALVLRIFKGFKPHPTLLTLSISDNDLVKGMKVEKIEKKSIATSKASQIRGILEHSAISRKRDTPKRTFPSRPFPSETDNIEKINLFGSKPLGYFQPDDKFEKGISLKTWNRLSDRDLRLAVTHPPANYFQQMILWTQQGKIWKFPIDNEQDMEKEQDVYFTEHVFLEKYLEPWCPSKGPIRHFMELVCVGLSKNPYMSVEHKKEHLEWYKDYFSDKQKLLKDIGALPQDFKPTLKEKPKLN